MPALAHANPAHWWRPSRWGWVRGSATAMFISPLRKFSMLCVLLLLVLIIGGYWYLTDTQRASALAQRILSRALGGQVTIGRTHVSLAGVLRLNDVALHATLPDGTDTVLFHAASLEVRLDWFSLLSGNVRAAQVLAYQPTLNLVEDHATGRWNYEMLERSEGKPSGTGSMAGSGSKTPPRLPFIQLRDAHVEWGQSVSGTITTTAATTIDGELSPDPDFASVYRLRIDEQTSGAATPTSVTGVWDLNSGTFSATTSPIDLAQLNVHSLPEAVRDWLADHALRGRVDYIQIALDRETGVTLSAALSGVSWLQEIPQSVTQLPGVRMVSIDHISGDLSINLTHGRAVIHQLHARVLGQELVADLTLDGLSGDAPFDLELQIPHGHVELPYPTLCDDIPLTHDLIQRLRPRGDFGFSLSVKRTRWNGDVFTEALVECRKLEARFAEFPYPLTDVEGNIRYVQDHVVIRRLTALAGESAVVVSGMAGTTPDNQAIDMWVRAPDAQIDERLAWCLPANIRPTWDQFNPSGVAGLTCHVVRQNGETAPAILVTIEPKDIAATFTGFPYPLQHIQGKIDVNEEQTTVEQLTGIAADGSGGQFTCTGTVKYPQNEPGTVVPDLRVTARGMALDHTLLTALPESYTQWLARAGLSGGHVTMNGTVKADTHDGVTFAGNVALSGGTLQPPQLGIALQSVAATVVLAPEQITLNSLAGQLAGQPDSVVHASGDLQTADHREQAQAALTWQHVYLPATAPRGVPEQWAARWNGWRASGEINGTASASFNLAKIADSGDTGPADAGSILQRSLKTYAANMRISEGRIAPPTWPAPVERIDGTVALDPHRLTLTAMSCTSAGATIHGSGTIDLPSHESRLTVDVEATQMPVAWLRMLPAAARGAIGALHPSGVLAVHLPRVEYEPHDPDLHGPAWRFEGNLGVQHATKEGSLASTVDGLQIAGEGAWPLRGAASFDGTAQAASVTLAQREITNLVSTVQVDPVAHQARFDPITGTVGGGKLSGAVDVKLASPVGYDVRLALNDADLRQLLSPGATPRPHQEGDGTVDAGLTLTGTLGTPPRRSGHLNVMVKNASLYDVPLEIGLVQLLTLRVPAARAFDSATITCGIDDDMMRFDKILLSSSNLQLAGDGTLDIKGNRLNLNFATRTLNELDIPLFTPLLQSVRDQLLRIHVGGTIAKPRIGAEPLSAITGPLGELLNSGGVPTKK